MIDRRRHPARSRSLLAASTALLLAACAGCQIGPRSLTVANAHYSDAVRTANSEQLLVNLVRLRYRDDPAFLSVSNISTQFEFGASGSVSGEINESGPDVLGLGAGIEFTADAHSETVSLHYEERRLVLRFAPGSDGLPDVASLREILTLPVG